MAVNDNDVELLESYLDGELPMSECEGLWRRLAVESELSKELDRLRADGAVRQIVFSSLEPSDESLAQLHRNIFKGARRQTLQATYNRYVRVIGTVAACLMFGFAFGWWGHDRYPNFAHGWINGSSGGSMADMGLGITPVRAPAVAAPTGKYVVNVRDGSGQVIATQQFDTFEEARQFADDFAKSQASHSATHDVPAVPVGDKF
ncbi:MAG: hypothetical protein ABSF29_10745 [Tepidisphaeraceae bacterium]|jgi:anti-sigma factor RsiW